MLRLCELYWISSDFDMAERGGFEPPVQFNPYADLANLCLKPLGHLSVIEKINYHKIDSFQKNKYLRDKFEVLKALKRIIEY